MPGARPCTSCSSSPSWGSPPSWSTAPSAWRTASRRSSLMLAVGLTPAAASASVHLAELGTTLVSGVSHWRFGNVDWRMVRAPRRCPGAVGAFAGRDVPVRAVDRVGDAVDGRHPPRPRPLRPAAVHVRPHPHRPARPPAAQSLPVAARAGRRLHRRHRRGRLGPRRHADAAGLAVASSPARSSAPSTPASSWSPPPPASASSSASATRASRPATSLALLAGGLAAAPLAAYLVRRIRPEDARRRWSAGSSC